MITQLNADLNAYHQTWIDLSNYHFNHPNSIAKSLRLQMV